MTNKYETLPRVAIDYHGQLVSPCIVLRKRGPFFQVLIPVRNQPDKLKWIGRWKIVLVERKTKLMTNDSTQLQTSDLERLRGAIRDVLHAFMGDDRHVDRNQLIALAELHRIDAEVLLRAGVSLPAVDEKG